MKQNQRNAWKRSRLMCMLILPYLLLFSLTAKAGLVVEFNDSSAWQGEVIVDDSTGSTTDSGDIFASYPSNFNLTADVATLTTSENTADFSANWSVLLFQEFMFDPIGAGSSLELSVDLSIDFTDPADLLIAQIMEFNTSSNAYDMLALDLSAGGTFDVTGLVGKQLSIEFGIQDQDFLIGEWLQISNLAVNENNCIGRGTRAKLPFRSRFIFICVWTSKENFLIK